MKEMKEQLIRTGRWIVEKNLTWGTSGNISLRHGDLVYITASGTVLGDLQEEDIILCDLDGNVVAGQGKPSKETGMHLAVYKKREDIQAILHASPFYSTMCSCVEINLKRNLFIEAMFYGERLASVPYCHAGSGELKEAVAAVCQEARVILMENHGILVYDDSLAECQSRLEIVENLCKMNILAASAGLTLKEVKPETVNDFLQGGYFKKRRD